MNKRTVRNLALKNGFKLKEQLNGKLDLNSYVYHFANELVKCQQQEMDSLKAQLAQYQSDDYVLVPKDQIEVFWQDDDEPENYCSSESDLACLGDGLDLDDIMTINKQYSAHIKTEKLFGTWNAEAELYTSTSFHVGTHEECLAIVAKNKAMIEAQEKDNG